MPVTVMFRRIAIDGLVRSAVDAEIRLPVALKVRCAKHDPATDRTLKNPSLDGLALPGDQSGQADVEGNDLHIRLSEYAEGGGDAEEIRNRYISLPIVPPSYKIVSLPTDPRSR